MRVGFETVDKTTLTDISFILSYIKYKRFLLVNGASKEPKVFKADLEYLTACK